MNSSKNGTVNAVSPCVGLQIMPFAMRPTICPDRLASPPVRWLRSSGTPTRLSYPALAAANSPRTLWQKAFRQDREIGYHRIDPHRPDRDCSAGSERQLIQSQSDRWLGANVGCISQTSTDAWFEAIAVELHLSKSAVRRKLPTSGISRRLFFPRKA